jgi:hypothetical protein
MPAAVAAESRDAPGGRLDGLAVDGEFHQRAGTAQLPFPSRLSSTKRLTEGGYPMLCFLAATARNGDG